MLRESQRAFSTEQILSPTRWTMSVGAVTAGTTSRTSISNAMRMKATASCGVADCTCSRPNCSRSCGSPFRVGAKRSAPSPLPQRATHAFQIHRLFELLACRLAPRPVICRLFLDLCSAQDEASRPFGVGRREEDRHRASFGDAHQDRGLRAHGVQDRAHVVHPLLERADADAVGQAHAAFVEQDEPREGSEPFASPAVIAHLPEHLEIGDRAGHEDEVERSVSEHLIGDVDVAVRRVLDRRSAHCTETRTVSQLVARPSGPHSTRSSLDPNVARRRFEANRHAGPHRSDREFRSARRSRSRAAPSSLRR